MVICMTAKVILDKGHPKVLEISKGRKPETVITHKNKMQKYPVDTTCQDVSCLLLRLSPSQKKMWFQLALNKTFLNWDSLHARLNHHQKAWSYKKKKKHKKIKGYRKSPQNEPTVNRCLLTLDVKPFRSQVKGKHSIGREFQSLAVLGKKLLTQTSL